MRVSRKLFSVTVCSLSNLFLLPATAKRPVELYETLVFVASCLCESQFRSEERSLAVKHFEICGRTTPVAHDRKADRLRQVSYDLLLANSHLMEFLISDQPVGHIAKSMLNGLFVSGQSLLVLRFGQLQISPQRAPGKNRLTYLRAI